VQTRERKIPAHPTLPSEILSKKILGDVKTIGRRGPVDANRIANIT
jgi:hypothetical protein